MAHFSFSCQNCCEQGRHSGKWEEGSNAKYLCIFLSLHLLTAFTALTLTWLSASLCRPKVWVFSDSSGKPGSNPISSFPKGLLKRINHFWSACYFWVFFWNPMCNFADCFTRAKGASGASYWAASLQVLLYWNTENNLILSLSVHCF